MLFTKTISQLSKELKEKKISAKELTSAYLKRIEQYDPSINSFIKVTAEQALKEAEQADDLIKQGKAGPLTGIPIAQKDIFCTNGIQTTCGSKMLANFISPYDATVVHKLKTAGTVMLGKTNMDEFAMGSSNENSYFGAVKNPWDLTRIPGGSSGGSSAAVAARLVPGATGTDTGGSIRQPAALCGITGIKPTYGLVSRYGMIAFASSLDQGGPMAQTAEDNAILLNAMAGFDEKDSTSCFASPIDYTKDLNNSLEGLRIGLPKQFFGPGIKADISTIVDNAITELTKLGAQFIEVDLPHMSLAIPAYYVIAPAECSSNLARFDGVRYGYRCENPKNLEDLYTRSRGEGFGAEVKRRIMIGTYVLSAGYYDAYYLKALQTRRLIQQDFINAFRNVDMILSPTAPDVAFKLGEKLNDPVSMYLSDIYTIAVNLAGLPALSMPAGFSQSLPVGVQLIGQYFAEARLLNVAHRFQQVTDWHQQVPSAFAQ